MTQNDFFVAIQGIMTDAYEQGMTVDGIMLNVEDAISEWYDEMVPQVDDEND